MATVALQARLSGFEEGKEAAWHALAFQKTLNSVLQPNSNENTPS